MPTTYQSNGRITGALAPSSFVPTPQAGRTIYTSSGQTLGVPQNQNYGPNYGPHGYLSSVPGIQGTLAQQLFQNPTPPPQSNNVNLRGQVPNQYRTPNTSFRGVGQFLSPQYVQQKYTTYFSGAPAPVSDTVNETRSPVPINSVTGTKSQPHFNATPQGIGSLFGLQKSRYGGVIA